MSSLWVASSALCAVVFSVIYADDFGQGIWQPMSIYKCQEQDHLFKFEFQLVDYNSTHGGGTGHIVSSETFTRDFGMRLALYKYEDDEYQHIQTIQENSLFDFLNTYVKEDVKILMIACGIDPPEVPIEKGEYDVKDYVYAKKQGVAVYGSYLIKLFVMQGDKEVGCIGVQTDFKQLEE